MNNQQVNFDTNRENCFTISVKKPPKFVQFSLLVTILISLLFPIVVMSTMIIIRAELKIGIFIAFALFWGIAYFLFRVWTWNINGKENFEFGNEKVEYYADFKYFKDSHKQIDNKEIKFEVNELIDGKDKFGQLIISNENDKIESCIKVSPNELNNLIERLKNYA